MKYGINKVTLVGYVGDHPKVVDRNDGVPFLISFPFATIESNTVDGEEETKTTWHRIVAKDNADQIQDIIKKGDKLYVEGKINNLNWEDTEGNLHFNTEIEINNFLLLRSNKTK